MGLLKINESRELFVSLIIAILLTCAGNFSKGQNTDAEKAIKIQDSLKQDSLMKAEFYALIATIKHIEIDSMNVIDAKTNYKILFICDCHFSEGYNQYFDEQWSKISNLDSAQKNDFAKLDIKHKLNFCTDNLRRDNRILSNIKYYYEIFLGNNPRIISFGNKYVIIEGEKFYTYIGNQTSYGLYRTYYLERQ